MGVAHVAKPDITTISLIASILNAKFVAFVFFNKYRVKGSPDTLLSSDNITMKIEFGLNLTCTWKFIFYNHENHHLPQNFF